jgi:hypothetical protein
VEEVENRVSGSEDKVEELDQTVKDLERLLRKYKRNTQVQEAYRTPNYQDQKRNTPRHILIKTLSTQNKKEF